MEDFTVGQAQDAQHAAVDTTFVQFYPTLLPVAERMKTLSAGYLADEKTAGG